MSQKKESESDVKLHPLFRRRSSSVSTVGGIASGSKSAAKGKGKVIKGKEKNPASKAKKGQIKEEEIFEVLSSDEEAAGKASVSKMREGSAMSEEVLAKDEDDISR